MKVKSLLTLACMAGALSASAVYPIHFRDCGQIYHEDTDSWQHGGNMDYEIVPGTQDNKAETHSKAYYGDPLLDEDGAVTITRVEGGGCWFRTQKLTEPCPMEYCVLAFEYKSTEEIDDVVVFHHEYAGRNDVDITMGKMYTVADHFQTVYLPFNRGLNGWGSEEDYTKNYLWISTNSTNGTKVGWQLKVKNIRLLTIAEAEEECKGASIAEVEDLLNVLGTDFTKDFDEDMGTNVLCAVDGGANPLLQTSSLVKPLPNGVTHFTFDYKMPGADYTPNVFMCNPGLNAVPGVFVFKGLGDEDPYEADWVKADIDLTSKISELGFAQTFGSSHYLFIQCIGLPSEQTIWYKDVKWVNPNAAGVAEIAAPESTDARVFNIMGVECKGELAPGLYIRGGKKFIVR